MASEREWETPFSPYALAILRIGYGILWLQQTTWKIPPDFGLAKKDGLFYWTNEMVKYSFLPPHKFFVESIVLPHFLVFAWLTLLLELFIGFSHLLGILNRLGALAALAQAINLLVGLGRDPAEWPWSYLMLIGFAVLFLSTHPGRVFGLDGVLRRKLETVCSAGHAWARFFTLVT